MLKRILLPFDEISKAPKRLRRSLCAILVRWIGVWPRRDQVRLSGETSEKPLSSPRPRVAPSCRDFFYPRQLFLLPPFNGLVVALQRHPLRALAAPAHALHHMPDRTRMVTDFK